MCCIARRRVPVLFLAAGIFVAYASRVSVSTTAQIPPPESNVATMYNEFNWDGETQGAVLSAFFYGYIMTQLPGACMASKYGATGVFAAGILLAGVGTLLTPLAADRFWLLIAVRTLTGFGEGVTYPAMATLLSKWTPASEKTATMAFCGAGAYLGTAVSLPLSSSVMTHFGWRSVYWGLGVLVFTWLVPFRLFVYDSPEACPGMTQEELFIIYASAETNSGGGQQYELVERPLSPLSPKQDDGTVSDADTSLIFTAKRDARILYRHLKRPGLWAALALSCSNTFMADIILTELPSYFAAVMKFSVQESNTASFLPWVVIFVTTNAGGRYVIGLSITSFSHVSVRGEFLFRPASF